MFFNLFSKESIAFIGVLIIFTWHFTEIIIGICKKNKKIKNEKILFLYDVEFGKIFFPIVTIVLGRCLTELGRQNIERDRIVWQIYQDKKKVMKN
jgi:cytochrome bd-type quinol oxidase subunit 1